MTEETVAVVLCSGCDRALNGFSGLKHATAQFAHVCSECGGLTLAPQWVARPVADVKWLENGDPAPGVVS